MERSLGGKVTGENACQLDFWEENGGSKMSSFVFIFCRKEKWFKTPIFRRVNIGTSRACAGIAIIKTFQSCEKRNQNNHRLLLTFRAFLTEGGYVSHYPHSTVM